MDIENPIDDAPPCSADSDVNMQDAKGIAEGPGIENGVSEPREKSVQMETDAKVEDPKKKVKKTEIPVVEFVQISSMKSIQILSHLWRKNNSILNFKRWNTGCMRKVTMKQKVHAQPSLKNSRSKAYLLKNDTKGTLRRVLLSISLFTALAVVEKQQHRMILNLITSAILRSRRIYSPIVTRPKPTTPEQRQLPPQEAEGGEAEESQGDPDTNEDMAVGNKEAVPSAAGEPMDTDKAETTAA
ncbi:hypothetical protein Nepgr_016098 [Nepenthes gracilis]|uniref:Uncharacterized protein n=1 Tax=Nepenthes gracilis TaxID=150966 RepID=A0AAD3SND9_NEPGR|nr:hypothetical protein Nepgr_016098 [Nepenthes gracilis]